MVDVKGAQRVEEGVGKKGGCNRYNMMQNVAGRCAVGYVLSTVHIRRAVRCTVRLVIGTEEEGGGSAEK